MAKKDSLSFWGKSFFICLIFNLILLNLSAINSLAKDVKSDTQGTTISIETSSSVNYKSHLYDNPSRLVLTFEPYALNSNLKEEIPVNRGMVKKLYTRYYKTQNQAKWVKTITLILAAKTDYQITNSANTISIFVKNLQQQPINSTLPDELIIKDYFPKGWGSAERREAIIAAIKFVKIKRQVTKSLVDETQPSVLVEKKVDNSIRVTSSNLTPFDMIATGTKVLFTANTDSSFNNSVQPVVITPVTMPEHRNIITTKEAATGTPKGMSTGLIGMFLGVFFSFLAGVLIIDRIRHKKINPKTKRSNEIELNSNLKPLSKEEKNIIDELFLKEDELQKWSKYEQQKQVTQTSIHTDQAIKEAFNFPTPPMDIAERRKFQRADIKNTRGILNRALVGSKSQPFKNIRINDLSKGGLSFSVKSKEVKFRAPTIVKLYFSNSTKPVDLWVRVVWEKDVTQGEGKNVGAKFTRVPKETWERIMESFGHRLG